MPDGLCFLGIYFQMGRDSVPLWNMLISIGGVGNHKHTLPRLIEPAAAGSIQDFPPLVFSQNTLNLLQESVFRIIADRTLQEFHLAAVVLKFFDHDLLICKSPGQPIRARDQHSLKLFIPGPIAQGIQLRPVKAVAGKLLDVNMTLVHLVALFQSIRAQSFESTLDRLFPFLLVRAHLAHASRSPV
jgi:hypothetical protein